MRLKQRPLSAEMLVKAVLALEIIEQYPDDKYLPSYLMRTELDGVVFHVQVAADVEGDNVRIVTMYAPNPSEWSEDFRARRD
jgi:hypothetical protein